MAKKTRQGEYAKRKQERVLSKLEKFEEFEKDILPKLRKMLAGGASAQEIAEFSAAAAMGRTVTIAITSTDEGKALSAAKDVIDRAQGKAKESVETTHKFEKLEEDQLDALLQSKLEAAGVSIEENDDEESHSKDN